MSEINRDAILDEALRMPEQDRAVIALRLLSSLDDAHDLGVEAAWQEEARRRLGDFDADPDLGVSWEDSRRRLTGSSGE